MGTGSGAVKRKLGTCPRGLGLSGSLSSARRIGRSGGCSRVATARKLSTSRPNMQDDRKFQELLAWLDKASNLNALLALATKKAQE